MYFRRLAYRSRKTELEHDYIGYSYSSNNISMYWNRMLHRSTLYIYNWTTQFIHFIVLNHSDVFHYISSSNNISMYLILMRHRSTLYLNTWSTHYIHSNDHLLCDDLPLIIPSKQKTLYSYAVLYDLQ